MRTQIISPDKEIESISRILSDLRSRAKYVKPITYDFLKPHIKEKFDTDVLNVVNEKIEMVYEAILTDEIIFKIANYDDEIASTKIYNMVLSEKYKSKIYNKLSANHPVKIASKIIAMSCIVVAIIGIIIGVIVKESLLGSIVGLIIGCILGFGLGMIISKIYIYSKTF